MRSGEGADGRTALEGLLPQQATGHAAHGKAFICGPNLRTKHLLSWVCQRGCHPVRSPGRGLRWGGHESRRALAHCLPDHGRLQGLEAHIVQRDPEGQELGLIGAQQVAVGLADTGQLVL